MLSVILFLVSVLTKTVNVVFLGQVSVTKGERDEVH